VKDNQVERFVECASHHPFETGRLLLGLKLEEKARTVDSDRLGRIDKNVM
jgi:hypothetical protein